jgi:hypothetical protein
MDKYSGDNMQYAEITEEKHDFILVLKLYKNILNIEKDDKFVAKNLLIMKPMLLNH